MSHADKTESLGNMQLALIALAKRELAIRVTRLDSLPETDAFQTALLNLIKRYPRSRIRVLYSELGSALESGHLVVGLTRRLSSSIFLRQAADWDITNNAQWWLADRFGLLTQQDESKPQASLDEFAKTAGPKHHNEFEMAWNRGTSDPHLRELFV